MPLNSAAADPTRVGGLIDEVARVVGERHVLVGDDLVPFLTDETGKLSGRAIACVRPGSTREVADVVRLAIGHSVPIVPQGGNTGLCGGATPDGGGRALVLSLQRLNRIRGIDLDNDSVVVEAGCPQQTVHEAVRVAGRLFPLNLPSRGTCTIGGNLATNAGGVQVLRYGTARQLTLGVEVVTAGGEIWDGLKDLRKDNTGYDLRDLYIGSEGTLGIITAASLRLFPLPRQEETAFAALPSIEAAVGFLALARSRLGELLTSFELIAATSLALVARHLPETPLPYGADSLATPWHVLVQASGDADVAERLEATLAEAFEAGHLVDAVVARSLAQARELWNVREGRLGEAARRAGGSISHDISLAVSRIPRFLSDAEARLREQWPGVLIAVHGHLGDGNLHYNVLLPPEHRTTDAAQRVRRTVYDSVAELSGSFSAEHGIGQTKTSDLRRYKSPVELGLMRAIKAALDPDGLLNPGKVLI